MRRAAIRLAGTRRASRPSARARSAGRQAEPVEQASPPRSAHCRRACRAGPRWAASRNAASSGQLIAASAITRVVVAAVTPSARRCAARQLAPRSRARRAAAAGRTAAPATCLPNWSAEASPASVSSAARMRGRWRAPACPRAPRVSASSASRSSTSRKCGESARLQREAAQQRLAEGVDRADPHAARQVEHARRTAPARAASAPRGRLESSARSSRSSAVVGQRDPAPERALQPQRHLGGGGLGEGEALDARRVGARPASAAAAGRSAAWSCRIPPRRRRRPRPAGSERLRSCCRVGALARGGSCRSRVVPRRRPLRHPRELRVVGEPRRQAGCGCDR